MGADPIVYCLEQITDYIQFERLCNDLMKADGYKNLEPLGGSGDKGRDALHINHNKVDDVTIFAYSVREDWLSKLKQDAKRINSIGHNCTRLVFCCTARYTATDRDNAVRFIKTNYDWTLELYGIERIRMLLSSSHERILNKHPHIFPPPFFPIAGGQQLSFSSDLVIIDFSDHDVALASWVARKLKLHGFMVWCRSIDPVGGESINDTIEILLEQRAAVYLSLLSQSALLDNDLTYRRASAARIGKTKSQPFLIPIIADSLDEETIDRYTKSLEKINFRNSWQTGLDKVIKILDAINCPITTGGKEFALNSFFPEGVVIDKEEKIISNIFPVLQVPNIIHRFVTKKGLDPTDINQLSSRWAFRKVNNNTFLSFHFPSKEDTDNYKLVQLGGGAWHYIDDIDGILVKNLVPELIRKSLIVKSQDKGLKFCPELMAPYFPEDLLKNNRYYFNFYSKTKTFIKVNGVRKYFQPGGSEKYKYFLSPKFYVVNNISENYDVIIHVYIRLTDINGKLYKGRTIISRRKHLCKNWFNDKWSKTVVGIMQFLGTDGKILLDTNVNGSLIVDTVPKEWVVQRGINEEALYSEKSINIDVLKESSDTDEE